MQKENCNVGPAWGGGLHTLPRKKGKTEGGQLPRTHFKDRR